MELRGRSLDSGGAIRLLALLVEYFSLLSAMYSRAHLTMNGQERFLRSSKRKRVVQQDSSQINIAGKSEIPIIKIFVGCR